MRHRNVLLAATVSITLSAAPAGAQANLQPGKYVVTMEMTGVGEGMPPIKTESCVTSQDAANIATLLEQGAPEEGCKVSNMKFQPDRAAFSMSCVNDGERYEMSAELRFASDSYHGLVTTKTGGEIITTKISGKRLGPCDNK
jgi:hypothetical protein